MDIIGRIKEFISNQRSKGLKKNVESLTVLFIIGIIAIIAGGSFFGREGGKPPDGLKSESRDKIGTNPAGFVNDEAPRTAKEIEGILSQIKGAGKVSVMVTYTCGKEEVPAVDQKRTVSTTDEKDDSGGTRKIEQQDYENRIIFEENATIKKPYILKEIQPVPKGAVIVAEGADDFEVRERLCKAAQVLLDIPLHKVQVYPMTVAAKARSSAR